MHTRSRNYVLPSPIYSGSLYMNIDYFIMTMGITGLLGTVACLSRSYIDYVYKVEIPFKWKLNGQRFPCFTRKLILSVSWNRIFLQNLLVVQLLKKFACFCIHHCTIPSAGKIKRTFETLFPSNTFILQSISASSKSGVLRNNS
jgi:hypothetical protein